MVYEIPPGGGGKPYPASGLNNQIWDTMVTVMFYHLFASEGGNPT